MNLKLIIKYVDKIQFNDRKTGEPVEMAHVRLHMPNTDSVYLVTVRGKFNHNEGETVTLRVKTLESRYREIYEVKGEILEK